MEPLRTSDVNTNSRVMTIPITRCDDSAFDRVIKQEFIDDTNSNNDDKFIQMGAECKEEFNSTDIEKKDLDDLDEGFVFEGAIKTEFHPLEPISQNNSDKTSNLRSNSKAIFSRNPKIRTSKSKMRLVCHSCENVYYNKSDLITHILCCTGADLCKSDISKKRYTQAGTLKIHKNTHNGVKPKYKCDICGKIFSRIGNLNWHKKIHAVINPYKCDICDKTFPCQSGVTSHSRTHTGDRPFKCDICNQRFTQTGSLNRHKNTHNGDKPFQCDICYQWFSQARSLKRHKNTHYEDKPYNCDICGKGFNRADNLKRHKITCHTEI